MKHVINHNLYTVGIMSTFEDDCELDEILIGVDLESSSGRKLDLSLELVGTNRSHKSDIMGKRGLSAPEGKCDREGALAMSTPSTLIYCVPIELQLFTTEKNCVKNSQLGFSYQIFLAQKISTKYF